MNDIDVEVVGGRLVISGERRDDVSEESAANRVSGFRYGEFKRAFRLGRQVTAEQVSASYDAGVLTVRVVDAYAQAAGQKIEISTGAATVESEVGPEVVED
ncbi:MAG: heat shock protein [Marmoricola sp.]|nr:heat shock protein [Marmoricola sp.]